MGVHLTEHQLKKMRHHARHGLSLTLTLSGKEGPHQIPLTKRQMGKLETAKRKDKAVRIELSHHQLVGSGVGYDITSNIPLFGPLFTAIGNAVNHGTNW